MLYKVPKRYKENLYLRFNPNNAKRVGDRIIISKPCELCNDFREIAKVPCVECPFWGNPFCQVSNAIRRILGIDWEEDFVIRFSVSCTYWNWWNHQEALQEIQTLRAKWPRAIKFI